MDVEGCEWDVLKTADLSRVTQLIIELHDMQDAPLEVITKLNESFYLAHIHGNNCHNHPWIYIDRVHRMPRYLECTYVRKDLVSGATLDLGNFPIPEDVKCRSDVPELTDLNFWKPCEHPITFVAPDDSQVDVLSRIITKEDSIVSKKEDARGNLIFVLEKNDIVPIKIIFSLDTLRQGGNILFPVYINQCFLGYEVRLFNQEHSDMRKCEEPIMNFR
jgi:hypothetical protein